MDEIIKFIDLLDNETLNKIRYTKSDAEIRRILKTKIQKKETLFEDIHKKLISDGWELDNKITPYFNNSLNSTNIICQEKMLGNYTCIIQCEKCKTNNYNL